MYCKVKKVVKRSSNHKRHLRLTVAQHSPIIYWQKLTPIIIQFSSVVTKCLMGGGGGNIIILSFFFHFCNTKVNTEKNLFVFSIWTNWINDINIENCQQIKFILELSSQLPAFIRSVWYKFTIKRDLSENKWILCT